MYDIERRIKTAANQAVRQRNYRRARDRALARLSQAYPNHYRELLEEEKRADERESKKWIDISGATDSISGLSDTSRERANTCSSDNTTNRKTQTTTHQSNVEGEES